METILIIFQNIFYVKGRFKLQELIMTAITVYLIYILWIITSKGAVEDSRFLAIQASYFISVTSSIIACYRAKLAASTALGHVYFAFSLLTTFLWNILFFRFNSINAAFSVVIVNLVFLVSTYFDFDKNDRGAGILALPPVVMGIIAVIINFIALK